MNGEKSGIYIHIPFCDGKCPYCDFYSVRPDNGGLVRAYYEALIREFEQCAAKGAPVDTIYFGGGTPLLLGADLLCGLIKELDSRFFIMSGCEITAEVNPRSTSAEELLVLKRAGFSRLSIGAQSGVDTELAALGRRHTPDDIAAVTKNARSAGFDNISMDIMIAIPGQDKISLAKTIDFYSALSPEHISAYILKIEPETPFGKMGGALDIPDEDGQAELYLEACGLLEAAGYEQYEISNFCRGDRKSRHNLKYWNGEEYLGFGASAHGFYKGKRYYHPRDIVSYIDRCETVQDGEGGGMEEYIMLRLRLSDGLSEADWLAKYGEPLPESIRKRAERLQRAGVVISDSKGIRLTRKGFLVSNAVIADIISVYIK